MQGGSAIPGCTLKTSVRYSQEGGLQRIHNGPKGPAREPLRDGPKILQAQAVEDAAFVIDVEPDETNVQIVECNANGKLALD